MYPFARIFHHLGIFLHKFLKSKIVLNFNFRIKRKMIGAGKEMVRWVSTNSAAPLRTKKGRLLDSIMRVDHAGEFGADRIYAGQMAILGKWCIN